MSGLGLLHLNDPTLLTRVGSSRLCRYCCKTLFALLIKNSPGYRRDVRVKMWGTSSPDDKLVSDLAKATEAIKIAARRSDRLMAGKLSPCNFGLLQQYLPAADITLKSAKAGVCQNRTNAPQQSNMFWARLKTGYRFRCSKVVMQEMQQTPPVRCHIFLSDCENRKSR